MNADQFNALYPVGTLVFAYPGFRPEDASDARRLVTRTRTAAQLSPSGDPVVWVEGEGSYICLTHVDPVPEDVWEEARAAEKLAEPSPAEVPVRLDDQRLAEALAAYEGHPDLGFACCSAHAVAAHVPVLLAELAAVRAERDQARAELAGEAATGFFQTGHTYARWHHSRRIEFHVVHVATAPDCDFPTAFGWRKDPEFAVMLPMDSDDLDGWTDITPQPNPTAEEAS